MSLSDADRACPFRQGGIWTSTWPISLWRPRRDSGQSQALTKPYVDFSFNAVNGSTWMFSACRRFTCRALLLPQTAGPFELLQSRVNIRQSLFNQESLRRKQAASADIVAGKGGNGRSAQSDHRIVARFHFQAEARRISCRDGCGPGGDGRIDFEGAWQSQVRKARRWVWMLSRPVGGCGRGQTRSVEGSVGEGETEIDLLNAMNRDLNTPLALTDPLAFTAQEIPVADQAVATALQSRSRLRPRNCRRRV